MDTVIIAGAAPISVTAKVVVSLAMVALATCFVVSGRKRQWKFKVTLLAATYAVLIVIALEVNFPQQPFSVLDGRGVLAAFIGLVCGGVSAVWFMRKSQ